MAVSKATGARTAAKTPVKAAPVKAAVKRSVPAKKAVTKPEPVEEDLLAGLGEPVADDPEEELDLLDGLTADQGDSWTPHLDEDQPDGIQGKLISRTVIESDAKYGGGAIPLLEIQESNGHVWSVRGYHSVLRGQIEKNDPQIGDVLAIKYLGEVDNKKGDQTYFSYKIACPKCNARL